MQALCGGRGPTLRPGQRGPARGVVLAAAAPAAMPVLPPSVGAGADKYRFAMSNGGMVRAWEGGEAAPRALEGPAWRMQAGSRTQGGARVGTPRKGARTGSTSAHNHMGRSASSSTPAPCHHP